MSKISVTVIIPVKNEEKNLAECLFKLKSFDEVIVVDSNSTDRTTQIAYENGAEYVEFTWDGKFPKKRNWVLRNIKLRNEWVLFLDADEFITNEFITELKDKIQRSETDGYWLKYRNYFMGKELKYGDVMTKLALFRKGKGEYERIDEDLWSQLDMEIHEHPIIDGNVEYFNSHIIHKDYKGLEHYITKHNAYSTWEANRYLVLKKQAFEGLTSRQKIKYRLITTGLLPFIYFIGAYIFKLGFLDGIEGYYLAKYKAYYFFTIQTKIKEFSKY